MANEVLQARKSRRRWDFILIFVFVLAGLASPKFREFKEGRVYRDLMGLTPFTHVTFASSLYGNTLTLGGTLRKKRCTFNALIGYVITETGVAHRVVIDTSPEDARGVKGNRPASEHDQSWGPWQIVFFPEFGLPKKWEIHAAHKDCPSEPKTQSNLFASGEWGSWPKGVPDE